MKSFKLLPLSVCLGLSLSSALLAEEAKPAEGSPNPLRQLSDGFSRIFEKAAPSVVIIDAIKNVPADEQNGREGFDFFFNNPPGGDVDPQNRFKLPVPPNKSEGSGFIVRADGYIFTNNHVIDGAEKVEVRLKDGRHFPAKIVGADDKTDIAVLKIEATGLPTLELGDSDAVRVGQLICSIGVPFNLDYSFACGWVSAKGRNDLTKEQPHPTMYEDYLQTDSFVNPGDSGGPVMDIDGKVIGMNTLINGIGRKLTFAIPSNMLREVGYQLIANGKIVRSWLGIIINTLGEDPSLSELIKGIDHGVVVRSIEGGAPAYKSDLRVTDVITQVDGREVATARDLQKEILKKKVGQTVNLTVWRNGKTLNVAVATGELPSDVTKVSNLGPKKNPPESSGDDGYGFQVQDMSRELAEKLKLKSPRGAMVTDVAPNSPADKAGVQREDLITEVDSKPVTDAASCKALTEAHDASQGLLLFIDRKGQKTYAVLKRDK